MLICYDQRNGSGCNALNPDNAPKCQKCGRNLQFALHLHDPHSMINHYQIIQVIGRGGFGAVYEAKDTRSGAIVALKESFDAESVRGFQREFDILSRLQHPNLTRYYEMFEAEGNGYLIMEFIAGQSLWEIFQKQRAPLIESQVLGYAMQLCDVLSYLHTQPKPIIHRDIKPANVRLTPEGLVKLVDFGLVKRGVGHTATSMPGLSPNYAPIEQWGNLHGHTDARSDIYSLGATLYHLLSGQPPLPATGRLALQQDPLMSPQHHNPALSPHISAAVMQALQLRVEARYETVLQFKQGLLGGQAVSLSASQRSAGQAVSPSASQPVSPSASQRLGDNEPTVLGGGLSVRTADRVNLADKSTVLGDSQPVGQPVARPTQNIPWGWIGAGAVVILLLVIMGLLLSRGQTAVVEKVVTATVAKQSIAVLPTDTPIPPTSTPIPTETRIPSTETTVPLTDTPIPPTATAVPLTDTPIPPTGTPIPPTATVVPTNIPIPSTATQVVPPTPNSNSDMVWIPTGEFIMGDSQAQVDAVFEACQKATDRICLKELMFENAIPQHIVSLGGYTIDKYETTNAQYATCVIAGKCTPPYETKSHTRDSYYNNPEFANYPVIYVDWTQAKNYCAYVNKRLPTEAEWEKAARGTDGRIYPWGNDFDGTKLNFCDKNCPSDSADKTVDDGYADTAPVGSYPNRASPYEVYDMSGNVLEWTLSDYKFYPYKVDDGRENLLSNNNKSRRGGAWNGGKYEMLASSRYATIPTVNNDNLGFRCAQ